MREGPLASTTSATDVPRRAAAPTVGDVVAERFELLAVAGRGGMGVVFRAHDRVSDQVVAVKVVETEEPAVGQRFRREVRALASLRHPGIVQYIAHGTIAEGRDFVVMEWIDGEMLSDRLARGPLNLADAVALGARLSEALGAAHARGIVHRDLKPSNVALEGGDPARAKLLDFGIARPLGASWSVTQVGVMVGTPGYMAPEQARGEEVDARADLFGLGCVLFRAIADAPPFEGDDALAVALRSVLEDAPRLIDVAPFVPRELDELVAALLARSPKDRPASAAQVAHLLRCVPTLDVTTQSTTVVDSTRHLTATERRIVSVVLARPLGRFDRSSASEAVARAVETLGARPIQLQDGAVVVTFASAESATDQAARAARCALALRAELPGAPVVLATGFGVVTARAPFGDVIDRAARLLGSADRESPTFVEHADHTTVDPFVRVDELTRDLLDARFETRLDGGHLSLVGEHPDRESARTLLGRPTPVVGRDRELRSLFGTFEECIEEGVARACLVTGGAGIGKSRLRHELDRKLRAERPDAHVWLGRGDASFGGAPLSLLARPLARFCGLRGAESLEAASAKVEATVARFVPRAEVARVAAFVGEIVGVPIASVAVLAAHRDPVVMSDQLRRAFVDLARAAALTAPLILELDDLQWADGPSVRLIDAALREIDDAPFFVVAFARPEVHAAFPRIWADRALQETRLGALPRAAAERLVKEVLPSLDDAAAGAITARAGGNALYLEELIRAAHEGRSELPDTVLAMVHSRLASLDPEARRVLRAASVLGPVAWTGAVRALASRGANDERVEPWIDLLVEQELLARRRVSEIEGEVELVFRSELVREGAYSMLVESDRQKGHRAAAEWLMQVGFRDANVLADHLVRAGDVAAAATFLMEATERALALSDLPRALALSDRVEASGVTGEPLARALVAAAEAAFWSADGSARARAERVLQITERGSALHVRAIALALTARAIAGDPVGAEELARSLDALETSATSDLIEALLRASVRMAHFGKFELSRALLDRAASLPYDEGLAGLLYSARATLAMSGGDPAAALAHVEASVRAYERVSDARHVASQLCALADARKEVGDFAAAERWARAAQPAIERLGLSSLGAFSRATLAYALAERGELEEAEGTARGAMETFLTRGEARNAGAARVYVARIVTYAGRYAEAVELAKTAARELATTPPLEPLALATLSRARLLAGDVANAVGDAGRAYAAMQKIGGIEEGESLVRLVMVEALEAAGQLEEARGFAVVARDLLLERAAKITHEPLRASFLHGVPENAATLAAHARLCGG
jgi:hypothetical protein